MTGVLLALAAAYGVFLLHTSIAMGWTGLAPGPRVLGARRRRSAALHEWMVQAGIGGLRPVELAAVLGACALVGGVLAYAVFAGLPAALAGAGSGATFPVAAARARRERRRAEARTAWPRMIEEVRIATSALGRSIPQALFEVGRRAPDELRPAFAAAQREWLLSTDFPRTVAVLKDRMADATADTVAETLLVAHETGGGDVDRCLAALVDDRVLDLQGRRDAEAHQAGARFARRFVLVVPLGMALVGLTIGDGRAAYRTATGQALVLVGIAVVAVCWVWAGRIMRLPDEQRVFRG